MTTDLANLLRIDAAANAHARNCKKTIEDCQTCEANISWYRGLPLPTLSQVLADRPRKRAERQPTYNAA